MELFTIIFILIILCKIKYGYFPSDTFSYAIVKYNITIKHNTMDGSIHEYNV